MQLFLILLLSFSTLFAQQNFDVEYFEDISAEQTIKQIITKDSELFTPLIKYNFGSTDSVIWLKVTFINNTDKTVRKIFEFRDNRLDRIEIYRDEFLENIIGDLLPFNNREIKSAMPAYSFVAQRDTEVTYYLRIVNKGTMNLEYETWNQDDYRSYIAQQKIVYAFYYGATIIMIMYNFVLFLFLRQKVFLDYVVYHFSLMGVMLYFNGIVMIYYSPDSENLNLGNVPIYFVSFTILIATKFMRSYLRTKQSIPKFDRYILMFMSINIFSILLSLFDIAYNFNHLLSSIVMVLQSVFLLYISLYLIIVQKSQIAKFYFLGWGIMLFSVVIVGLISLGLVPRNNFTTYLFQLSSLAELLLLSMGLAFRYNEQQKLVYKQEQQLITINQNLEQTIRVRTKELDNEVKYTKTLLNDREILFKELYHRVKNNLQMMVSLLSMQKRRVDDINTKEILDDMTGRIQSLALIHEKLQTSDELDQINMQEYLNSLLNELRKSYQVHELELNIRCNDVYMNIDKVTSIGLIVNELTNNSFKHAFKDSLHPIITIELYEDDKQQYQLHYSDNGEGYKEINKSNSFGTTLVNTLIKSQLKGEVFIKTEPSLTYHFSFPTI